MMFLGVCLWTCALRLQPLLGSVGLRLEWHLPTLQRWVRLRVEPGEEAPTAGVSWRYPPVSSTLRSASHCLTSHFTQWRSTTAQKIVCLTVRFNELYAAAEAAGRPVADAHEDGADAPPASGEEAPARITLQYLFDDEVSQIDASYHGFREWKHCDR